MSEQAIEIVCALLPVFAVVILFATPKGCVKTINTLLAVLIIFIFGFEEAARSDVAVSLGIYDGKWFDASIGTIYILMIPLFYRAGGRIQSALTFVGVLLSAWYYLSWTGDTRPINLFYSESFILLTAIQLFIASEKPLKTLLDRMLHGGNSESISRNNHNGAGGDPVHRSSS
jgi:hypothetical protein